MIWEYLVIDKGKLRGAEMLNEFGRDGWELVAAVHDSPVAALYFKRQKEAS
jgi:hypothetical protein